MSKYAIRVENVSKMYKLYDKPTDRFKEAIGLGRKKQLYREHYALNNISFDVKTGECVGIIGTNGSGKSTLLKLMNRIIYPTKGKITKDGKLTSLLELGAGFHDDFTGRENIYFNASIFGLTKEEIDKKLDQIIEFSELEEFIDNPVRTYSSGMYMRLAFSVAINVEADILLIDEILAVGDQHFQDKCFNKLIELKNAGKTIVIVTHSMDQVRRFCDRAIWLYEGEVHRDGQVKEVLEEYLKVCGWL